MSTLIRTAYTCTAATIPAAVSRSYYASIAGNGLGVAKLARRSIRHNGWAAAMLESEEEGISELQQESEGSRSIRR